MFSWTLLSFFFFFFNIILGKVPSQAKLITLEWAWFDYFTADESICPLWASVRATGLAYFVTGSVDRYNKVH